MTMLVALLMVTLGAPPGAYHPCEAGLAVEYRVENSQTQRDTGERFVDVVRGPGTEPRTCIIDRETRHPDGRRTKLAWMIERSDDRVTYAGLSDQPIALRPPLLAEPLRAGAKWQFDRHVYEVHSVDAPVEVPAGRFVETVRIHQRSFDGKFSAYTVYALGVGPVISDRGNGRLYRAVRVVHGRQTEEHPMRPRRLKPQKSSATSKP